MPATLDTQYCKQRCHANEITPANSFYNIQQVVHIRLRDFWQMKVNLLCPFIIRSFYLRRLDAGGEELDEFGAVVAKRGKGLVGFDELGIA